VSSDGAKVTKGSADGNKHTVKGIAQRAYLK